MIKFESPYFRVTEPIIIELISTQKIQKQSLSILYLTDVVFNPKKYQINNKLQHIGQNTYKLTLDFSFAPIYIQKYNQMLNNIGLINIRDINRKMAMILSKQKDAIYLTFIAQNNGNAK